MIQITIDELNAALNKILEQNNSESDVDGWELTVFLLEFFYDRKSVDDRCLSSHDRDTFYKLDEMGVVSSTYSPAESSNLINCRRSWILRSDYILQIISGNYEYEMSESDEFINLYSNLPVNVWEKD